MVEQSIDVGQYFSLKGGKHCDVNMIEGYVYPNLARGLQDPVEVYPKLRISVNGPGPVHAQIVNVDMCRGVFAVLVRGADESPPPQIGFLRNTIFRFFDSPALP